MTKVFLQGVNGSEIYNDFSSNCNECIKSCFSESKKLECPIFNDTRRIGKIENEVGKVFSCTTDKNLINSSKSFKREVSSKILGIEQLISTKEKLNSETKNLLHNLTKTNGHNIQELYALVPQEILTQNLNEQLKTIQKIIEEDSLEAAKTFLRIAKNNAAMKTEFSVFNKLFGANPSLHKKMHPVKKVTLNLFHIYFQKFKELNVYVDFDDNEDYLIFDYESIHVSLYHLIDNASKYILPSTPLHVHFHKDENDFSIILDMISLRIEEDEKNKLLEDGFSGRVAKKLSKSGDGIGLGRVGKILQLNDAELIIRNNVNPNKSINSKGVWYDNNIFEIRLKNYNNQQL
jgi:hypothetical protein